MTVHVQDKRRVFDLSSVKLFPKFKYQTSVVPSVMILPLINNTLLDRVLSTYRFRLIIAMEHRPGVFLWFSRCIVKSKHEFCVQGRFRSKNLERVAKRKNSLRLETSIIRRLVARLVEF